MKPLALIVATASLLASGSVSAQRSLDAPPPLPPANSTQPAPAPKASAGKTPDTKAPAVDGAERRTLARLPEAERAKEDAPVSVPDPTTEPPDEKLLAPAKHVSSETRIEQVRQGNRVKEIIVTPAGTTNSYVILNREGRPPLSTQELSSGLSTPRFLHFDF